MKQLFYNVMFTAAIFVLLLISISHTRQLKQIESQIQTLKQNHVQLIGVNGVLAKGVSDVADSMIQKATWDKDVAEKLRELDQLMKDIYGQTNQSIPQAIR